MVKVWWVEKRQRQTGEVIGFYKKWFGFGKTVLLVAIVGYGLIREVPIEECEVVDCEDQQIRKEIKSVNVHGESLVR